MNILSINVNIQNIKTLKFNQPMNLNKIQSVVLFGSFVLGGFLFATNVQAQSKKSWVAPLAAQRLHNPIVSNSEVLEDARTVYVANCVPCHGSKGKGDGPAAAALNPKPADHTSAKVQKEKDGSLFWKISEGNSPMPKYKTSLSVKQRWELVDYIRSLAKK